jgi:hypothetical protein
MAAGGNSIHGELTSIGSIDSTVIALGIEPLEITPPPPPPGPAITVAVWHLSPQPLNYDASTTNAALRHSAFATSTVALLLMG